MPLTITRELAESAAPRFLAKVDRSGDCWLWTASRLKAGYGQFGFFINRKLYTVLAHRVSYVLHHGEIPDGMFVMHTCDNPSCVNPAHLTIGTPADNSADMTSKGRSHRPKGEIHPLSKLTEDDIREIRRLKAERVMTQREISRLYGLSESTVCQIIRRLRWDHVK